MEPLLNENLKMHYLHSLGWHGIVLLPCSSKMRDIGEKQFSKVASGDTKPNSWTLLDFGKSLFSWYVYLY